MKLKKVIGKNIQILRKAKGMIQAELAEAMRLSLRHLQNIEYGKSNLNISHLSVLSEIFKLDPCHFLKSEDDLDPNFTLLDLLPVGIQYCDCNGLITYSNKMSIQYPRI